MRREMTEASRLQARVEARLEAAGVAAGDGIVVGVSGGADSVALLRLIAAAAPRRRLAPVAAHLHHGLRGEAADADAEFVAALCRELGVPLYLEREDVGAFARAHGMSVEEAGRALRRRLFDEVRRRTSARWLALGHHADDQAETLLLRLMRGAGLVGAGAMAEAAPDGTLRPLLAERRATLRAYLAAVGQPWREDATNALPDAERNRVRLGVLPALEAARPGSVAQLALSAARLRQDGDLLRAAVDALLPPAVADNGGPWRTVPWPLWRSASTALRAHLLRQAAWAVAGRYPPAPWTEAWARWPERRAARPDVGWVRVAAARDGAVLFPPTAPPAVPLPPGPRWRQALPGGAVLERRPASGEEAAKPAALRLGDGGAARAPAAGERVWSGRGAATARALLRAHGVPPPCRDGAWVVDGGEGPPWLPLGARDAVVAVDGEGRKWTLVWEAPPTFPTGGGWPGT